MGKGGGGALQGDIFVKRIFGGHFLVSVPECLGTVDTQPKDFLEMFKTFQN